MIAWRGAKVLVTGAGGFIGSHLVDLLVREGADVRAFVRYTSHGGHGFLDESATASDVEVVLGDVRDASSVKSAVDGRDVVFHLAALIGIPYSYEAPDSYIRTNIEGTLHVLEATRAAGALLVNTSTSEVYGTAQRVPMDETHPLNAQSPYAATKVAADMLALSYARSFGARVAVLRPFNTYGPRQSARAVIPTIASQLLAGDEVRVGSLHPERDLTFVSDTVAAFLAVARSEGCVGRVTNSGSGVSVSIRDLIERIAHIVGRTPRIYQEEVRVRPASSEVDRLRADTSAIRGLTGWRPQISLDEGLRRTIDWIASHPDRYRVGAYAR